MEITTRPVRPDEWPAFRRVGGLALAMDPMEEMLDAFASLFKLERTVAALDGEEIVGCLGNLPFELTVPGGRVRMGGTSFVGVLPSHRRRGVLRKLMQHHLEDVRRDGQPVAGLWSSESGIYGRFGFGPAAYLIDARLERVHARFRDGLGGNGTVRVITLEDAPKLLPPVYDRVLGQIPGMLDRTPEWWTARRLLDPPWRRGGASPLQCAIARVNGVDTGYALYRRASSWRAGVPDGRLNVVELVAADPETHLSLWRYLTGVDLVKTIQMWNLPVDDALEWHLADPRRLELTRRDSLWVRILDIPKALSGRRYNVAGEIVLSVSDPMFSENNATYRLCGGPDGADVTKSTATADLTLSVRELGALYLGGNRTGALARAGLIAGSARSLALADSMFASDPAPWCPEVF